MTKHCQNCTYRMSGNPPVCNALHTPIAGEIDCADWKVNEAITGGLTPDGLYLRERLDQGQVPLAEIIQRGRSEQVENGMEVARVTQPQSAEGESLRAYYQMARSSPAISLSELRAMCDRQLNPFRDGQELHARSQSTGRIIEFIAIATPNGLKWQYQGAVIID